uniref:NADH-ubiquinone oxidoreductase chain 1 n=1 Tax=Panopea globosa TaxID=1237092 RepID=A0A0U1XJ23_9BIVA|nr:NADH dehydrogenase subunit 1 [Panopea globosa]AIU56065.1 NADH dehydrogenase subunit 1 [Panopea globosa]
MMLGGLVSCFVTMVLGLLGVAFFIVTERKGLGMLQLRKGPNKVSFKALGQPISDGVKLLSKGWAIPASANKMLFIGAPGVCFIFAYILWLVFPSGNPSVFFEFSLLYFICVSCINVYGVLLVGWSCNSQYGLLGAMRAVAQSISYEVSMSTLLFCPLVYVGGFSLGLLRESGFSYGFIIMEVTLMWLISVLAETNRAPFDFVEGESELVSGYNVEFGGAGFALIALAEYSNIVFMSLLSVVVFFSGGLGFHVFGNVALGVMVFMVSFAIVWVRGAFPRFRYDKLMMVCWGIFLPLSLVLLVLCMSFGL